MTRRRLVLRQHMGAPAETVFDAWLDPQSARRWLFATPDGEITVCEIEPRVGGSFRIVDRRGDTDADHRGQYLEIQRPSHLVFGFQVDGSDFSDVIVEIDPLGEACEVALTHEFDEHYAAYEDLIRSGWIMILDGLKQAVEAKP